MYLLQLTQSHVPICCMQGIYQMIVITIVIILFRPSWLFITICSSLMRHHPSLILISHAILEWLVVANINRLRQTSTTWWNDDDLHSKIIDCVVNWSHQVDFVTAQGVVGLFQVMQLQHMASPPSQPITASFPCSSKRFLVFHRTLPLGMSLALFQG